MKAKGISAPRRLMLQFRGSVVTSDAGLLYKEMLPLLNSGKIELLDNQRLIGQLVGLERRTARGGKDSIDHPPGAHDDIANSVAGALLGTQHRSVAEQISHALLDKLRRRDLQRRML
jgi:hypothetical protein